jgi:SWI/SNF chromatin-remodeling complex subunit SWI1
MGTPGMFHNPGLEKQMAALNAANIAKMANRSAPGSAQSPVLAQSSSGYFGGNSLLQHQGNGNNMITPNLAIPSPSDQHLQSSSLSNFSTHSNHQSGGGGGGGSGFQQNMNVQPSNSMSIGTPTSAGSQNAFPDPNSRSTLVPNQQVVRVQQVHKRRHFIQTIGFLMLQRGQPLPQALTGVPIPPGVDPNASPWKNLEPQIEVTIIRLAGKDFDLYKFFGIVYRNGGGVKVRIPSISYVVLRARTTF